MRMQFFGRRAFASQAFAKWIGAIALAATVSSVNAWANATPEPASTPAKSAAAPARPLPAGVPARTVPGLQARPKQLNPKVQSPFERIMAPQLKQIWKNAATAERTAKSAAHKNIRQFDASGASGAAGANPNFPSFVAAPFFTLNTSGQDTSSPEVGVTGDFNGDGKPDVAIIQSGGTVTTILNNGSFQNFASVPQLPPNTSDDTPLPEIAAAYAVDINQDGKLDIVGEDLGNNNIVVWTGNGDGTFGTAVSYPVAPTSGAYFLFGGGIVVADFNHDGHPDVAAITTNAIYYPNLQSTITIQTFLNDGTGKLVQPTTETDALFNDIYEEGSGQVAVVSNDGSTVSGIAFMVNDLDLNRLGNAGTSVIYVSNNGDGSFSTPIEPAGPAILAQRGSQTAFSANAAFYATNLSSSTSGEPTTDIVFMTGDGAVYDTPYTPGTGSFTLPAPNVLVGANVNDAAQPVVSANGGIGNAPIPNTGLLNLADMNNDGLVDLVVYTAGSALIFPNQGSNTFGAPTQVVGGLGGTQQPQPANFDGSGSNSFVWIDSYLNGVGYYQNFGGSNAGQFYAAPTVSGTSYSGSGYDAMGSNIQVETTGDFNGDGLQDVIAYDLTNLATNSGYPDLVVGFNNGKSNNANQVNNFTFTTVVPAATLISTNYAFVEPFSISSSAGTSFVYGTATGGLDIVTAGAKGSFGAPTPLTLGTAINCPLSYGDSGDVNGDGVADIVVAYTGDAYCGGSGSTPSGFFTFLGKSDGTFGTGSFTALGGQLYMVKLINFNGGSGNLDIAAIDNDGPDSFYSVYAVPNKTDGSGGFNTQYLTENATGYIVTDIIPGDFNNDGKPDLTLTTEGQYVPLSFSTTPNTMGVLLLPFQSVQVVSGGGGCTGICFTQKASGQDSGSSSGQSGFYYFGTPTLVDTGFYALWGSYADFNGDGYPDLALVTVDSQAGLDNPFGAPPAVPLVQILPNQQGYFGPVLTEMDSAESADDPFSVYTFTGNFGNTGGNDLLVTGIFNTAEFLNQGSNTLSLTASTSTPVQGAPVTLTATITQAVSGYAPTGSVSFSANGQVLGAAPLTGNSATLTTADLPVGVDTLTASYSGDASHNASTAGASVTVTAATPMFALTPGGSSSLSLQQGATGTVALQVASNGTFTGTIAFTCSGAPAQASCNISPASLTMGGNQSNTVTVVVATTAPNNTYQASSKPSHSPWLKAAGGISVAGVLLVILPRRRRLLSLSILLVLSLGAITTLSGCGGSGTKPPTYTGTPAGNSTLTITATSGSITQTQTIALTITQPATQQQ